MLFFFPIVQFKFCHMPLMRSVVLERVYTRREALAQKNQFVREGEDKLPINLIIVNARVLPRPMASSAKTSRSIDTIS